MDFRHEESMRPIRDGIADAKQCLDDLCESYSTMPVPGRVEHGQNKDRAMKKLNTTIAELGKNMATRNNAYRQYLADNFGQSDAFPMLTAADAYAGIGLSDDQVGDEAEAQALAWKREQLARRGLI